MVASDAGEIEVACRTVADEKDGSMDRVVLACLVRPHQEVIVHSYYRASSADLRTWGVAVVEDHQVDSCVLIAS